MFSSNTTQVSSGGYQISRSLRFNSPDSAYLNRTPASATNQKTWTWSGWVKRSTFNGTRQALFTCNLSGGTLYTGIEFNTSDQLVSYDSNASGSTGIFTTQVFRDPSAWYHIVLAYDTTQATASNRVKIYVNGTQVTSFSTADYPSQNSNSYINSTNAHSIGSWQPVTGLYFNGYMTEINFVDGSQLTPSSFGETNAQTGVWQPKAYSGSYGTNGFYLNFSDNSNTTAATLGKDYSGNGNNWTSNNFSVTAGAGNDSLVDSPTSYGTDTGVGGTVRGNYCTWNPLNNPQNAVLTNGNLDLSTAGVTARYGTLTTIGVSSAKWYWEITAGSLSTDGYEIGIASASKSATSPLGSDTESYIYLVNGDKRTNATTVAYGATYTAGDVIGVALDLDAGTLTFYKNGTSQGTAYTSIPSNIWFPTVADDNTGSTTGSSFIANFGQRPFAYTAPSGYKALCTQNLPTPTIGATTATQAGKYFNPVLYTGNGTSQSVTGVGFQPDLVWIKLRDTVSDNDLNDAVRGATKVIESNLTAAEFTEAQNLQSFNSDGFTVGSVNRVNMSGKSIVAWNWKANGSGSTNTSGSITSTVSANTTSGFSVVTYTNASSGTVGHGLGVAPAMVIYKDRTNATNWVVLHQSLTNMSNYYLSLNTTNAVATGITLGGNPTSSVIYTNTNIIQNSAASVAYCFAEVSGYSKFGSYVGNGSADGPFVYTGFKPAYVMIKETTSSFYPWCVFDKTRDPSNVVTKLLLPNASDSEYTVSALDFNSNGFKIRDTNTSRNNNGSTYIFMAIAENPFKYSLAR